MASTYLTRTPSSATNRKTFTFSVWIKRNQTTTQERIFDVSTGGTTQGTLLITSGNKLQFYAGSGQSDVTTNRLFRDVNAWYHIVLAVDTTQATASDRVKLYVNGVQETSFQLSDYPSQNYDTLFNSTTEHRLGKRWDSDQYFNGYMSHAHFIDGTAYDASAFGSTDSTTGEWKINTSPSVTYGTNGFFILKDGNSVTDQSGNSNNFTVAGGTLTNTEDCPSNVFATLNPLQSQISGATLSNGNNKIVTTTGSPYTGTTVATLGVSSGKYYWEAKVKSSISTTMPCFSIVGENCIIANYLTSTTVGDYVTYSPRVSNEIYERYNDGANTNNYSYGDGSTINVNDIIGCALDKDNGKVFWSINGVWQNSGDPVNGTYPASSNVNNLRGDFVFPAFGDENYSTSATLEINFGNGYFGTTAVSSAGTNASGNGIFEYDVPTGFTALSTKGLNE
jgi:hypothetical protein